MTGGCKSAIPVVDLSETFDESENERIGGFVHSMDWDQTSERLAVTFVSEAGGGCQPFIALFRTRLKPVLEITSCGFIRGDVDERPCFISFQKNFRAGALLTVCWSNTRNGTGRIGYIPLHFIPLISPSVGKVAPPNSFPDSVPRPMYIFSDR